MIGLMKMEFYKPNEVLFERGKVYNKIAWVYTGELNMFIHYKSKDILLDTLYRNCIVG